MRYELFIPILAGLAVMALGGAIMLARAARRAPLRERLRGPVSFPGPGGGGSASVSLAAGPPTNTGFSAGVDDVLVEIGRRVGGRKTSASLSERLVQAGYHDRRAPAVFIGAKAVLLIGGAALLGLLMLSLRIEAEPSVKITAALCGAGLLFFVPNLIVASRRSKRRAEIRRHLPDAIDLLEICASAGMGMDMAWNSVSDEVRAVSPTLADEMALTNLEIHLGAPRVVAMRNMARRTGADELSSLVAVLVQSERFGTSVVDALRTYANAMRETRSMRSQEAAEKMAVKLLFPMILFIFPSVILVMVGPAGMTLFKVFAPD